MDAISRAYRPICTGDFRGIVRSGREPDPLLGAGIPLLRDGVVVGAISNLRRDRSDPSRPIDLEAMELLAGNAA